MGKGADASQRKPSESKEWSEAKEEHERAIEIWKGWSSSPEGLKEGSWRRCLGNRAEQEGTRGKGRNRKAGG